MAFRCESQRPRVGHRAAQTLRQAAGGVVFAGKCQWLLEQASGFGQAEI